MKKRILFGFLYFYAGLRIAAFLFRLAWPGYESVTAMLWELLLAVSSAILAIAAVWLIRKVSDLEERIRELEPKEERYDWLGKKKDDP